jgi:hypothetical protein
LSCQLDKSSWGRESLGAASRKRPAAPFCFLTSGNLSRFQRLIFFKSLETFRVSRDLELFFKSLETFRVYRDLELFFKSLETFRVSRDLELFFKSLETFRVYRDLVVFWIPGNLSRF